MKIKQLSVFLENRAGMMVRVTETLAAEDVNILALSLADTSDFGILRLILSDIEKGRKILREKGFVCKINTVTAVELSNKPGALSRVLKVLEQENVNVEYIYAFSELPAEKTALIFRFDDAARAVECLADAGISVYAQVDLK